MSAQGNYIYNQSGTAYVYARNGDIYFTEVKTGKSKRITQTTDNESGPRFCFNETKIVYSRNQNLYAWDIAGGETIQLTNIKTGESSSSAGGGFQRTGAQPTTRSGGNPQEQWLQNDQLTYFQVLKDRKSKREMADAYNKSLPKEKELRSINLEDKTIQGLSISPDGRFVSYRLFKAATGSKTTIVPSYVTETGFTTDIPSRTKVGSSQGSSEFFIYDREKDTILNIKTDSIPGIKELPDYVKDYPKQVEERQKKAANRLVNFTG